MQLGIKNLNEVDASEIGDFLVETNNTLLYSSLPFLNLLEHYLNCELKVILARENEKLIGYFPLAFKNSDNKRVCNSLPYYGSNGGMVVSGENEEKRNLIRKSLYDFSIEEFKNSVHSYTIISNPLDIECNDWLRTHASYDLVDERIGQITHFPGPVGEKDDEVLMSHFEDPRPRNIRKARKEGIIVGYGNTKENIDFLYNTHFQNITAINGLPKEKKFFEYIPEHFNDSQYRIYTAEINGEKIAALLLFYFNETVEYFTPATVEKYRNAQPGALVIYEAMLDAMKMGYKNWNWGGTWLSQGGVYDFKKRWGTTDHRYYYYIKLFDPSLRDKPRDYFLKNFPNFFVLPFSALNTNQIQDEKN